MSPANIRLLLAAPSRSIEMLPETEKPKVNAINLHFSLYRKLGLDNLTAFLRAFPSEKKAALAFHDYIFN
jgi:hypothetical protein